MYTDTENYLFQLKPDTATVTVTIYTQIGLTPTITILNDFRRQIDEINFLSPNCWLAENSFLVARLHVYNLFFQPRSLLTCETNYSGSTSLIKTTIYKQTR